MVHLESVPNDTDNQDVFHVKPSVAMNALVNAKTQQLMTNHAAHSPADFWALQAERIAWMRKPTMAGNWTFDDDISIRWFEDGTLNASVSCLDRHLPAHAGQPALIWEADEEGVSATITYGALHEQVCRLANAMKALGVGRGDKVGIYLPMVPEAVASMLACARIGAVHSVMFAGFSPTGIAKRLVDCGAKLLITGDEQRRGGKKLPLKRNADEAMADAPCVRHALVVRITGADVPMTEGRDVEFGTALAAASPDCQPEEMHAEDPLFILYTSGSTGAPKGLVHTTGGYLVWAAYTHEIVFDIRPEEIFWCTADVGWVTGHSYGVYGPLANRATSVIFEGVPTHPDAGRLWRVVDRHHVGIFYTAPTAIRALMRFGDEPVRHTSRASLRLIGSVGEPINPEAWLWYYRVVGDERCPIVDTWWQTETGGIMISPLPGAVALKPGSATLPLPGVMPVLADANGHPLEGEAEGQLLIAQSWPGQARTIHGDHERFRKTYFAMHPGYYTTGDGARRDAEGYYWITGRVDDVINVSGHRIGTAEVEAALDHHGSVVEAAVVGVPHEVKGQGIYAYVVLRGDKTSDDAMKGELAGTVRKILGAYAVPDTIHVAPDLPKTRSGKIMRRILRKIATGDVGELGDTSTLADPGIVDILIAGRE